MQGAQIKVNTREKYTEKLTNGYKEGLMYMGFFACSPPAAAILNDCNKNAALQEEECECSKDCTTCIVCSPIILPMTAVTTTLATVGCLLTALSAGITYPTAALIDCCIFICKHNEDDSFDSVEDGSYFADPPCRR